MPTFSIISVAFSCLVMLGKSFVFKVYGISCIVRNSHAIFDWFLYFIVGLVSAIEWLAF